MNRFLGTIRFATVHVLGLALLVGGVATTLAGRVVPFPVDRWRARLFQIWCRTVSRVIGMKTVLEGTPPEGGFLLVANHQGYLDILALSSRLVCVFVARGDLASWPFVGWITRSVGTLYVRREKKRDIPRVSSQVRALLSNGTGVVVFPEGTNTDGTHVLPFKSGFLEAAVGLDLPVHHATIRYRTPEGSPPAEEAIAWFGPFYRHLYRLLCLPRITCRMSFGDEPIRGDDRKLLAERLHAAVRDRLARDATNSSPGRS